MIAHCELGEMVQCYGRGSVAIWSEPSGKRYSLYKLWARSLAITGHVNLQSRIMQGMEELSQSSGYLCTTQMWQLGAVHYHEMLK